jgi:hypothetical protein|tara:strand:+ start:1686 stop:1952 length:267 start_codon:yes stop_codon:yes gene_type:complete
MNWVQIWALVTALLVFNISHYIALNKMMQVIENVQLNISSQKESLSYIFERVDNMGKIVSDNFVDIEFVKKQTDAIHLRMAAYENTIN